jgi:hypothetical protein
MTDTGGPAFPTLADNGHTTNQDGMTLRDYFAAKAMQGMIACDTERSPKHVPIIVESAYVIADAMLKERSK